MIKEFQFENFRSFKDKQVLNFEPEALKENKNNLHICYKYDSKLLLQKSIAIFGYNAYGKSNALKAFEFFISTIFNSYKNSSEMDFIPTNYFKLNDYSKDEQTRFEITLIIDDIKLRYGFSIKSGLIETEELYYSEPKIRENNLYIRKGLDYKISNTWHKNNKKIVDEAFYRIKPNSLILSTFITSKENPTYIDKLFNYLKKIIIVPEIRDNSYLEEAVRIYLNFNYREIIQKFIDNSDLGFRSIYNKLLDLSPNTSELEFNSLIHRTSIRDFDLFTQHVIYDKRKLRVGLIDFDLLKDESSGSIKLFFLICYIAKAIKDNSLILVDEIDAKLHANLISSLLDVYHNEAFNSQLIFTLHNTNIISQKREILRRDQIYRVDKNEIGESEISRMHTSKNPIRSDQDMEREYLKGKYKGIPKNQLKLDID